MMDYFRQIFSLIFAISLMVMLLDCEIKEKKHWYLIFIYSISVFMFDGFIFLQLGYSHFMNYFPLLVQTPVFLVFVIISKFNFIKVSFVHLTVIAICTSFTIIGIIVSYFFGSSNAVINIVCYMLYLPVGYLIYKYLRPQFLYMLRNSDKGWLGFCIIPLSYCILIYTNSKYNIDQIDFGLFINNIVLFYIMAFSAYYMIFRFFVQTREQLVLQNEQTLLQMQVAAAQVHLEELKESQEKTILYRHDMRHHLNLINAYLIDDNKFAAQKYIAAVEKTIEDVAVEKYCTNYTVNLILSAYISKAKAEQITVETQINVPVKNAISDMDLCVIFANVIDNAVNACKCVRNIENRFLNINCKIKEDKLFIQVSNSYEGTILFEGDMPVSLQEDHGFGTKSMVVVVEKYNGIYSFSADHGVFKTSVIL